MPIYEDEGTYTRDKLLELRKRNRCKECGDILNVFMDFDNDKAFLACNDWRRTHHEGIVKEASRYQKEGLAALNIETRREIMTQEYGQRTTRELDKYLGVVSLTKPQALEILLKVFPEAPQSEIARAVLLSVTYGLNPLAKHLFLIPFNKGKPNESWATVLGIKAKRLLASRRGAYGYVDDTPRVMTDAEQKTIFGTIDRNNLWVITKLKDTATGAEAPGYGGWPFGQQPYGMEKGNTAFNMAAIRSESQALDRLRPGEMPVGVEVAPEEYMESDKEKMGDEIGLWDELERDETPFFPKVEKGEIALELPKPKEHWCSEHGCSFEKKTRGKSIWYAHKLPDGKWCNEASKKETPAKAKVEILPALNDAPTDAWGADLALHSQENELPPPPEPETALPKRDPETIKTITDLFKACHDDWKLQPKDVIKDLGVNTQSDISDSPADCYRKEAALRG